MKERPHSPGLPGTNRGHAPRLFAIRLWKEELGGGSGYRGTVRDVATDAHRSFDGWSDLVAFMVSRLEQTARDRRAEEVGDVRG